jgi:lincosamide nucleotidyltransferase B/F
MLPGGSQTLHQWELIERIRSLCRRDHQVVAALMYGSFVAGEGDRFSDVEFWIFIADNHLPQLSIGRWINQIEPTHLIVANEYGTQVAIFTSLVRGEFHFVPASTMAHVRAWGGISVQAEEMIVVDRTGELTRHLRSLEGHTPVPTPDRVDDLIGRYLNWFLLGINVLERGEIARAHAILVEVDTYLLWLVRLVERVSAHWLTPSRNLEGDISATAQTRYIGCTAPAQRMPLVAAYKEAWHWGQQLLSSLAQRHTLILPDELLNVLDTRVRDMI